MLRLGKNLRPWWVAAMAIAMAATITVSALPQPAPVVVSFAKTIETNVGTIEVSGIVTIDAASRSANGTLHVKVTNATGGTIVELSIAFWNNGTVTGPFTESIALSEAGVLLHVTVDPTTRAVTVDVTPLAGAGRRGS